MKKKLSVFPRVGMLALLFFQGLETCAAPTTSAAFTPLKFGEIKPRGWIEAQMRRDLQTGFAGRLDELCAEARSDIFVSGRNRPGHPNRGNVAGAAWWNGETEGNWRCGHSMLACLTSEPAALAKAQSYIDHILAGQDADGYIGIFSPEFRYRGAGELWTQTCLFRGLLAYADAMNDARVRGAVKRAVDRTVAGYAACTNIPFTQHDAMYSDVLEYFYAQTGDKKYLDFGLRIFRECANLEKFLRQPEISSNVFNLCYNDGHGATVTEVMRIPFWLWAATRATDYLTIGTNAIAAMNRWTMPSGALVSDEWIKSRPHPTTVGYEYCTLFEREFSLIKAGQIAGDATDFQAAEHLWFNAAQGAREPDGSAVLYCTSENRPAIHDEFGKRQRFSPTHQHVAVCCNPNASRIAAYFISHAWMRPNNSDPGIAATLYGPCSVTTTIADTQLQIEEQTGYPYSGDIKININPERPVNFCLWLRNPTWSPTTKIVCPDAQIQRVGDFWQVRKLWKPHSTVTIHFEQTIRAVPAINGEIALQYGPLLYALPIAGEAQTIKTYGQTGFKDYYVTTAKNATNDLALLGTKRDSGFGFTSQIMAGVNPDFPLDQPALTLTGTMLRNDGTPVEITLVPMGTKSAALRRITFPIR